MVTVIAIDGPAGAGKSTVGRALAKHLGLEYLDTGAMYRAVAFAALRRGIPVTDDERVAELARGLDLTVSEAGVVVDGVDATAEIRSREVTEAVSAVAANTPVREELRARQRRWAAERGGGVIEGRDIATVVFPDATLKLYVTASPRVRAERRVAEIGGDVDEVEVSIAERDRRDMGRVDGPLRPADGSVTVDTTGLDGRRGGRPARRPAAMIYHFDAPEPRQRPLLASRCAGAHVARIGDTLVTEVETFLAGNSAVSRAAYYVARAVGQRVRPPVDAPHHRGPGARPHHRRVRPRAGAPLQHGHARSRPA